MAKPYLSPRPSSTPSLSASPGHKTFNSANAQGRGVTPHPRDRTGLQDLRRTTGVPCIPGTHNANIPPWGTHTRIGLSDSSDAPRLWGTRWYVRDARCYPHTLGHWYESGRGSHTYVPRTAARSSAKLTEQTERRSVWWTVAGAVDSAWSRASKIVIVVGGCSH